MSSFQKVIPVIDIGALFSPALDKQLYESTVKAIGDACRHIGFFYISNHHVPIELIENLFTLSKVFFAQDLETKKKICMANGGKAWRGYFAVGDEYTSGVPDQKGGLYFGKELPASDPRPLHGANLYPDIQIPDALRPGHFTTAKEVVEMYMNKCTELGHMLMAAIACSLGLELSYFNDTFNDPTTLFRIFNYPPYVSTYGEKSFGVGKLTMIEVFICLKLFIVLHGVCVSRRAHGLRVHYAAVPGRQRRTRGQGPAGVQRYWTVCVGLYVYKVWIYQ